ncbi:Uncharacterised protein [Mycobacteroides abscessus subsp. massiliense]|nr:Uncharacterised protein [Mycobacteroides abscessus subsp. massiliense]
MPAIDLSLQVVPPVEKLAVPRSQISDYFVDPGPESVGIHTGAREGLVGDEVVQHPRHAKVAHIDAITHRNSSVLLGGLGPDALAIR